MSKYKTADSDQALITDGRTLDYAAPVYDYLNPLLTFFQENRFCKQIIDLLELKGQERILDVGCGTGTLSIKIARELSLQNDSLVIGLDAARKMVERARRKASGLKNIRFDIGIAERLPYEDNSFDLAISTFFFHHVNFKLKKMSLWEIYRVLKKNGRAVIIDVDIPTNIFGRLCAWCGYLIFMQEEIKENIQGKLREALNSSNFRSWYQLSQHLGYISVFKLEK